MSETGLENAQADVHAVSGILPSVQLYMGRLYLHREAKLLDLP